MARLSWGYGKVLAYERKKAGMTQAVLAAQLGVSAASVGFWESGFRNPPREAVSLMRVVLGNDGLFPILQPELEPMTHKDSLIREMRQSAEVLSEEQIHRVIGYIQALIDN